MAEQEYDKEQLRILRNAFKAFDHDERGYIEHSDVQQILEILGQKLDDKAIKALITEVDKGKSGKLDFSQFCRLAARFVEVEEDAGALASELKEAFRVYDKEGKGYLTVQTLRSILHELDDKLSNQDLDMIIEEIDADGSGTVDFDEFMQVMTGKNYYDIIIHRNFMFAHAADTLPPIRQSNCYCPTHRMRLHRRIEWHFERFFQQMLQPFEIPCSRVRAMASAINSSIARQTQKQSPPTIPILPKFYKENEKKSTTSSTISSLPSTCHSTSTLPSEMSTKPIYKTKKVYNSCVTTTTTTKSSCYRPIFRPRYPKWIPILTLYREMLQNPFRRRVRYMITHE